MKHLAFCFVLLFLLFANMNSMSIEAQTCGPRCATPVPTDRDSDGDGVLDSEDRCSNTAGIAGNNGCPPPDRDGDGTADGQDRCPDTGGPAWNSGCPEGESGDTPTDPCASITAAPNCAPENDDSSPLPELPGEGRCVLGTAYTDRVNVRMRASTQAPVVAQLETDVIVPVIDVMDTVEGRWYRIPQGWVFGEVVRLGGNCADRIPGDSADSDTVICRSLVALSPINTMVSGLVLFSWTSPAGEVPVAFYQVNIYDVDGNWLHDTYTFEPETQTYIDLSALFFDGSEGFQWNVVALDGDENPLCASENYNARTGIDHNERPSCEAFAGIAPEFQLGNPSTDFSWTLVNGAAQYYLKLRNSDMELVSEAYIISAGDIGGYSLITTPEAIGEDDQWFWQVDAFKANGDLLCSTPLYSLRGTTETSQIPTEPSPEGLCDAFAIVSPEDDITVQPAANLIPVSWNPVNQPVMLAYMVYAGPADGEMLPQFNTTESAGTLDLSQFGDAPDIQWMVKAVNLGALAAVTYCESPVYHINRELESGETRPGRGINLPSFDPDVLIDWLCPKVEAYLFSDSPESTAFIWSAIPGAAAYRFNFYNAADELVESLDVEGFAEGLYTQLPFGPQDEWSFEMQLLLANGEPLCTGERKFVERDFDSGLVFVPVSLELSFCEGLEALSPLDELGSGLFTYFEWSTIDNVVQYDIKIYNAADELVFWGAAFPDSANETETRAYYTDSASIGYGPDFTWEVIATLEGGISCSTGKTPVSRPGSPFTFEGDLTVVNLELQECADFAPVAPLDFLGEGLFTYFEWTDLPEAEHYDLKVYNADNELVHWGYVPADHYGETEVAAYYTDEESIGAGVYFSWEVIATLESGLACATERVEVQRLIEIPFFPIVWDLSETGNFVPPFGRGQSVPDAPERGGGNQGSGNSNVQPLDQCWRPAAVAEGFADVLRITGAIEFSNVCNPADANVRGGLLGQMPQTYLFFFDAEEMGHDAEGTLALLIVLGHGEEGELLVLEEALFIPEGSELGLPAVQKLVSDALMENDAPDAQTLEGTLIGLLHEAGLESLETETLDFSNLAHLLALAGGLDESLIYVIANGVMQ